MSAIAEPGESSLSPSLPVQAGRWRPRILLWLAVAVCLPTLLPLGSTLLGLIRADPQLIDHLWHYVIPGVTSNSVWLALGVGTGCALLGTALAALIALTEFPGRRWFSWALVLPLAMPAYVTAVALIGLLDYSGPIASALRELGWQAWPEVRSRGGVTLTLILALYPYVYLVARGAFASQGARAMEAARSLGMSPFQAFRRAALPLARPWIAAGTLLVLMETLADFGTVAAFNYDTFTTAIYKAWFALFSIDSALAIAGLLLLLVLVLVALEQRAHRAQRFYRMGRSDAARLPLHGIAAWSASLGCGLALLLAFGIPIARLAYLAAPHLTSIDQRWLGIAFNSISLSVMAALLTVAASLVLALAAREHPGRLSQASARIATLGYGLPGALLAVGLYVPITHALNRIADRFDWSLLTQGGLVLLLLAYCVRFTAVAHAPVATSLARVRPSLIEASRSLGIGGTRLARQVYLPFMRSGVFTAALLVIVDVMKEMPITLMTRPFGWDTLATRVFEHSNEGQWAQAALPSLAIVAVGLLPVLLLERRSRDAA